MTTEQPQNQNESACGGSALTARLGTRERRVVKLIAEQLGINETTIVPTALLIEDLWMDSLDHIEVVMAIEDYFNVDIPDQDCEGIKTVQQVFDLVHKTVSNA